MKNRIAATIVAGSAVLIAPPARAGDLLLAAFSADAIYRYDGVTATPFASDPSMDGPAAMVYDGSGNLLVLSEFSHNVLKFNSTTGAFISTLISPAVLAGTAGITDPGDMEIGADGNLYIMSHFNSPGPNVGKFDATTGAYLGAFATTAPIRHQHGLAFGPGGHLYQGNVDGRLVDRFDGTSGAYTGVYASEATMFPIADLAFGPTSHLYVTVHGDGVAHFDGGGAFLGYLPTTPGNAYWGILVDGGSLYVSNLSAGSVTKFDAATGAFISNTVIGGGAFDIIPMVPEPSSLSIFALALVLRRRSRD